MDISPENMAERYWPRPTCSCGGFLRVRKLCTKKATEWLQSHGRLCARQLEKIGLQRYKATLTNKEHFLEETDV